MKFQAKRETDQTGRKEGRLIFHINTHCRIQCRTTRVQSSPVYSWGAKSRAGLKNSMQKYYPSGLPQYDIYTNQEVQGARERGGGREIPERIAGSEGGWRGSDRGE